MNTLVVPLATPERASLSPGRALRVEARLLARLETTRALAERLCQEGATASGEAMRAVADETDAMLNRLRDSGVLRCLGCDVFLAVDADPGLLRARCRTCRRQRTSAN